MADPDPAVAAVAPVMSWMVLASLYASRASLIRPTSAAWLHAAVAAAEAPCEWGWKRCGVCGVCELAVRCEWVEGGWAVGWREGPPLQHPLQHLQSYFVTEG